MSDLILPDEVSDFEPGEPDAGAAGLASTERYAWRAAEIAPGVVVHRALPVRARRTVGAWCFLDLAGLPGAAAPPVPDGPVDVGPHPHTGLQTVTWLLDGAVRHRDSLGSDVVVRPRELNVMTAGFGVAHSERRPDPVPDRDEGSGAAADDAASVRLAQLWVALPDAGRDRAPSFEQHRDLPVVTLGGLSVVVLVGRFADAVSPATVHTPLVGLDVTAPPGSGATLPLDAAFEHALVAVEGAARVDGADLAPGELLHLGPGRDTVAVASAAGARLLLLGGTPYTDELHMWWNFVGRSRDAVEQARTDWESGSVRFPDVVGDDGPRLAAPPLPWRRQH